MRGDSGDVSQPLNIVLYHSGCKNVVLSTVYKIYGSAVNQSYRQSTMCRSGRDGITDWMWRYRFKGGGGLPINIGVRDGKSFIVTYEYSMCYNLTTSRSSARNNGDSHSSRVSS